MAFPQDVNYIMNKLRDSYLRANDNDMSKRIMKPYLKQSQYYNVFYSNPEVVGRDAEKFDSMHLNVLTENKAYIENLYSNADSPPIQSNFYQDIRNRSKKYDNESDSDSNSISDQYSYGSPRQDKNTLTYSLAEGNNRIFDQKQRSQLGDSRSSSRRSSGESVRSNSITRSISQQLDKQRKPELLHRISNIKEETEDFDSENPQSLSVSSISKTNSNNKFQNFKKTTYRSSIGKFFTKSTAQKPKGVDDDDDSDSSDDDERSNLENGDSMHSSYINGRGVETADELIVDDQEETEHSNEDDDLANIDHDDGQETNSLYSISDDDSLIGDSFTDDDGADSVMDVAFERAALHWKLQNESLAKTTDNSMENGLADSIGGSINSQAFDNSESSDFSVTSGFQKPSKHQKQRSNSESQDTKPTIVRNRYPKLNRSVPNSTSRFHKINEIKEPAKLQFKKVSVNDFPLVTIQKESKLSSLLNEKKKKESGSPLEIYESISGENMANRAATSIKVYILSSPKYANSPLTVRVKRNSKVIDLIGYILLKYTSTEKEETKDGKKYLNLNRWKLQLSDEGEVFDEGFGILDRTKTIDIYQPDEVSLIEVDDTTAKTYASLTPLSFIDEEEPVAEEEDHSNKSMKDSMSNTLTLKNAGYSPFNQSVQSSADSTLLARRLSKFNSSEASLLVERSVQIRVFLYPETVKYDKILLKSNDSIKVIIAKFCEQKSLNKELYCAQLLNDTTLLNENDYVSSLGESPAVQILSKQVAKTLGRKTLTAISQLPKKMTVATKGLNPPQRTNSGVLSAGFYPPKALHSPSSARKASGLLPSSLTRTKNKLKHGAKSATYDLGPEPLSGMKLKRYTVWRRQQVNFMSRHEKVFTIDDEYVYVLPSEADTSYHSSKTSSFHISQMIRAKQSRKYPNNFKIIIRRKNSKELKRYDFEAPSPQVSSEIVRNLISLKETYKMNAKF